MRCRRWVLVAVAITALGLSSDPARCVPPPPSLSDLLQEYRRLGLPLPPKDAKLVRFDTGWSTQDAAGKHHPFYGLAFEVKAGTTTTRPTLLCGTQQWEPTHDPAPKAVEPDPDAIKKLESNPENDLVQAIQCHALGWNKLAEFLLARSQQAATVPPAQQLADAAWAFRVAQLTDSTIDRSQVAGPMKQLLNTNPHLDTKYHRRLVQSLELALVPNTSKPGTAEAAIDALVDLSTNTGSMQDYTTDERYARIVRMGFDAVPALITHLDDDRLTRAVMQGFNNFPTWHLRVGDVVGDLVEGLAAEELARGEGDDDVGGGWLRRQQGYPVKKAAVEAWWAKARTEGEESYLLARVLPAAGKRKAGEQIYVRPHLLTILSAKYPQHIPALYRKVLQERPEVGSWELATAVRDSKLPMAEKTGLLALGAGHKDFRHRLPALQFLSKLDQERFTTHLLNSLENLPADADQAYWMCSEAHMARLALQVDDPRVWTALVKAVKRSSFGLRMELLSHLGNRAVKHHRAERLHLLASYLDDATVRDSSASPKFGGPSAGFPYPKIEVRNFAATEITWLLGGQVETDYQRSAEEWAKIRNCARAAAEMELRKSSGLDGLK